MTSNPDGHMQAKVRRVTHDAVETVQVAYDALKPLGDPRPELLVDKGSDLRVGDFVFYCTDMVRAGVVSSPKSAGGAVTILVHEQSRKNTWRFSPMVQKTGATFRANHNP